MQALHTAATGMAAQELNVQVISNNIANLRTTGFKKQTRGVPGPDLRARPPRRRAGLGPGHHRACRRRHRRRRQDRRHAAQHDAGHAVADRQRPRPRDLGRRLLQDPDARRHLPVHPRRHLPDGQPGPRRHRAGQPGAADHHHPEQRLGPRRQRAGPGLGDAAGFVDVGRSGPDRRDPLHQQGGPRSPSATISSSRRPLPARRRTAPRTPKATARSRRAASSRPMSTSSRR